MENRCDCPVCQRRYRIQCGMLGETMRVCGQETRAAYVRGNVADLGTKETDNFSIQGARDAYARARA